MCHSGPLNRTEQDLKQINHSGWKTNKTRIINDHIQNNVLDLQNEHEDIFTRQFYLERLFLIFKTSAVRNNNDKSEPIVIRTTQYKKNQYPLQFLIMQIQHEIRDADTDQIKYSSLENSDSSLENSENITVSNCDIKFNDKIIFQQISMEARNVNNASVTMNQIKRKRMDTDSNAQMTTKKKKILGTNMTSHESAQYCWQEPDYKKRNTFFKNFFHIKLLDKLIFTSMKDYGRTKFKIDDFLKRSVLKPIGNCKFEFSRFFVNYPALKEFMKPKVQNFIKENKYEDNEIKEWDINPDEVGTVAVDNSAKNDDFKTFLLTVNEKGITSDAYSRILRSFNKFCLSTHLDENDRVPLRGLLDQYDANTQNWELIFVSEQLPTKKVLDQEEEKRKILNKVVTPERSRIHNVAPVSNVVKDFPYMTMFDKSKKNYFFKNYIYNQKEKPEGDISLVTKIVGNYIKRSGSTCEDI